MEGVFPCLARACPAGYGDPWTQVLLVLRGGGLFVLVDVLFANWRGEISFLFLDLLS
jgi:hypothetical protein